MKVLLFASVLLFTVTAGHGQSNDRPPEKGGLTYSLGLPARYNWHAGVSVGGGLTRDSRNVVTYGKLGVYKSLFVNPVTGVFGWMLEGYAGSRNGSFDGGARFSLGVPFIRLYAGVDQNFSGPDTDFILTLVHNIRRTGIFGGGTDVRLEWLPGRDQSLFIGVTAPVGRRKAGKTRARHAHVKLDKRKPQPFAFEIGDPELEAALEAATDTIGYHAHWVNRLTTPYLDHDSVTRTKALVKFRASMEELRAHLSGVDSLGLEGLTSAAEVRLLHAELDRAFSMAVEGCVLPPGASTETGRLMAGQVRAVVLDEIILPFNRSLGLKRKPNTLAGLRVRARGVFARWLFQQFEATQIPVDRLRRVGWMFLRWLEILEAEREFLTEKWERSSLVWLPVQFALRPEEHDTQIEIDRLIERATGHTFTEGNETWYIINEQFQKEFYRMVQEAQDYHVLWIHDFAGKNGEGDPDAVAFNQVKGYFLALIKRVNRYDTVGKFPLYMLVLDQFYWEANSGRTWSALLQNPMHHTLRLPGDFDWMEEEIEALQRDLRAAVQNSSLLQLEKDQYGDDWLRNLVKVHVNVTNPVDMSFWARDVIPLSGMPDIVMRDHRKISFYDATEDDPYRGEAIFTGMGIGEHYVGPGWEDRAVMIKGPENLDLKYATVQLLRNQGFDDDQIPYPLRVREKPRDYNERVAAFSDSIGVWANKVMQLHNETGYRAKPINVAKAMIYTLMPPGSILKVPDSLWNSPFWASMLMGNALRGGKVLLIAPSLEGAPSSGFPQMSRGQELWERLVIAQDVLGDQIKLAGGALKTGLYSPGVSVGDIAGRLAQFNLALREDPFLRELYPFDDNALAELSQLENRISDMGYDPTYLPADNEGETPKLHLKAQFFASEQGWNNLLRRPEWSELFRLYTDYRISLVYDPEGTADVKAFSDALQEIAERLLGGLVGGLSPEERDHFVYYLTVGSHNMDYRGMMMDGEVMYLGTDLGALEAIMDFIEVAALCRWVDTQEELDELLPRYGSMGRRIGRMIKIGL